MTLGQPNEPALAAVWVIVLPSEFVVQSLECAGLAGCQARHERVLRLKPCISCKAALSEEPARLPKTNIHEPLNTQLGVNVGLTLCFP